MLTRLLSGGSDHLDRLNLEPGELAVDLDRKALRVYDGVAQGGYEALGVEAYEPPPSPGPQTLMAGDLETGFYGEVPPEDFISYEDLSILVGLSAGTLHGRDQPWLKFSMDGVPAYVSKWTIRYGLSWNHLNARDLVFGRVIEIGDHQYSIRLMTGLVDPDTFTAGGEWNRLIYPIHVDDPNRQGWGIGYSNADIRVEISPGRATWMQEAVPGSTRNKVVRGGPSLTLIHSYSTTNTGTNFSWRPILEVVT